MYNLIFYKTKRSNHNENQIGVIFALLTAGNAVAGAMSVAVADQGSEEHREYVTSYPLHHASYHGNLAEVNRLLDGGADANEEMDDEWKDGGTRALMIAAGEGHAEVVKVLLSAGADVHAAKDYYFTALFPAVEGGHAEIVKILLAAGANPNNNEHAEFDYKCSDGYRGNSEHGYSILMFAINEGTTEIVKILLSAGADPSSVFRLMARRF